MDRVPLGFILYFPLERFMLLSSGNNNIGKKDNYGSIIEDLLRQEVGIIATFWVFY